MRRHFAFDSLCGVICNSPANAVSGMLDEGFDVRTRAMAAFGVDKFKHAVVVFILDYDRHGTRPVCKLGRANAYVRHV